MEVGELCRRHDLILPAGSQNDDGPDSAEATIRRSGSVGSLPVLTLADPGRLPLDRAYADSVVGRLNGYRVEVEDPCGPARLYLP